MNMSSTWPSRPMPFSEESFSSWFSRLAIRNGLSPSELYRVALPGGRLFRADLDRSSSSELLSELELRTGTESKNLREMTFRRWYASLIGEDDGYCKLPWLPASGTMQSKRCFGQQVCPLCLKDDAAPYFRINWRLSFITVCQIHKTGLIDRCSACQAPIQPLYVSAEMRSIDRCWNCGASYSATTPEPIGDDRTQDSEARHLRAVNDRWCELGSYGPQHAYLYFTLLWRIYRLLATGRFSIPLRDEVLKSVSGMGVANSVPTIKEVEHLNPRCRRWLLQLTDHLVSDWPNRFIAACLAVGISSRILLKDRRSLPFAYCNPIEQRIFVSARQFSLGELTHAKEYLKRQGQVPNTKNLQALIGHKFTSLKRFAEPANNHIPYGTHRYWKLDGISPETRSRAKRAAKLEGENIGPWVENLIIKALAHRK